ncbi:hypothetical protein V1478_000573 [Vespula squamosa]|uniref:Uncharacterized protein n=1 Tax=Vespula squamosa TaxID=30214 RepID=A0ABD2C5W4_VESSQ
MVHSEKYVKVVPPSKEENMGLVNKDAWSYQIWMGTVITGLIEKAKRRKEDNEPAVSLEHLQMVLGQFAPNDFDKNRSDKSTLNFQYFPTVNIDIDIWEYIWIEICTWFSQKARISTLFEESSEFQGGKPEFVEAVPY